MSLIIENSTKIESNIEKLINKLYESCKEINEKNVSADISPYKDLVTNVIKRANEKVNFNDFCYMVESPVPNGKIPYHGIKYIGKASDETTFTQMKVLIVPDSSAFTEGGDISTNDAVAGIGKVIHVEEGKILVQVTSGSFKQGISIDNVSTYVSEKTTISEVYSANGNYSAFLTDYVDVNTTADGEVNSDLKEIVSIIDTIEILCTTKEISSGYTIETLSDAINVFGYQFKDELIDILANMLMKLEQARIFKFMRDNAYQRPNIVLTNSYAVNGNLLDIFNDLYVRINQSAGRVKRNSNINGELVVVASSDIYRAVLSASPLAEVERKIILPSDITMVEDPYSTVDYLCVALNPKKDRNNAAVVYTPYSFEVQNAVDPVDFNEKVLVMSRSDINNNPLATKENNQVRNEMMEVTFIDGYENLNNVFKDNTIIS